CGLCPCRRSQLHGVISAGDGRPAARALPCRPVTAAEVAAAFSGAAPARVADWLATLVALGQARALEDGRFVAG
ncbi:MAG: hypothetical protein WA029_08450, partial [Anaerolineae bacterium]